MKVRGSSVGLRHGAAVFIACVLLASGCVGSWSMLGYGPDRAGNNPTEPKLNRSNVGGLQEAWSATLPAVPDPFSQPLVANGFVFVTADKLFAFDAAATSGCSGTPRSCDPLWTAAAGGRETPAVADDVIYTTTSSGSGGGILSAFDSRGVTNCSGTPKVCRPLWTAHTGRGLGSPAVSNGVVYVGSDRLYAFDATGTTGCSGTPKTCTPLWTSASAAGATPAVANGVVYANTDRTLSAFDATGTTGCSATTKTCVPLWTHVKEPTSCWEGEAPPVCGLAGPPTVSAGRVFIADASCCFVGDLPSSEVLSFDAAGQQGCSGIPKTCLPLATGRSGSGLSVPKPPVAIANGTLYADDLGTTAFAASGLTRVWQTNYNDVSRPIDISSASIANGVMYVIAGTDIDTSAGTLRLTPVAYDAAGEVGCSGTPKTCTPLWTGTPGPTASTGQVATTNRFGPTIANGTVYVRTDRLRAYALR